MFVILEMGFYENRLLVGVIFGLKEYALCIFIPCFFCDYIYECINEFMNTFIYQLSRSEFFYFGLLPTYIKVCRKFF